MVNELLGFRIFEKVTICQLRALNPYVYVLKLFVAQTETRIIHNLTSYQVISTIDKKCINIPLLPFGEDAVRYGINKVVK